MVIDGRDPAALATRVGPKPNFDLDGFEASALSIGQMVEVEAIPGVALRAPIHLIREGLVPFPIPLLMPLTDRLRPVHVRS